VCHGLFYSLEKPSELRIASISVYIVRFIVWNLWCLALHENNESSQSTSLDIGSQTFKIIETLSLNQKTLCLRQFYLPVLREWECVNDKCYSLN
jgi:hypothetical protein